MIGRALGPYQVLSKLGEGGMGEVYKAHDARLGRNVAIKVLSASLSTDREARARFEREARAISQLSHPHICALHDVGRARPDGAAAAAEIDFIVMEYLDGESLARRLAGGPLPAAEALEIARQIADALDKAHRRGIIHRDLKPANVMLTRTNAARRVSTTTRTTDVVAKLLDFGLAKLAPRPTIGSQETVGAGQTGGDWPAAAPGTAEGTILGTFQYMPPEQLERHEVDARADIWAFGCVLYEMLTGRRAFEGKSQASLIASILSREPTPVVELQPLTPPALDRIIRICLAKDPDARFQSSYDLLLQLQGIAEEGSAAGLPAPLMAHRQQRERVLWIVGTIAAMAIAAAGAWALKPPPVVTSISEHLSLPLPAGVAFTSTGRRYVAISPDGRRMAYVANQQIYVRDMSRLTADVIQRTQGARDLAFSPDGQWIAYVSGGAGATKRALRKISVAGGAPVVICDLPGDPFGLRWQSSTIVFGQNNDQVRGIQSVPDTPGTPVTLVAVGPEEVASNPYLIDSGRDVLFTVRRKNAATWDAADIVMQTRGETSRRVLIEGATDGRPLVGGRLIYYRGGTIFGIRFDARARATRGGPVPLVEDVQSTIGDTGAAALDVADNGTLVFAPGTGSLEVERRELVWVDRQGNEEKIPAPVHGYRHPRVSADGRRVVVTDDDGRTASLYIWDVERQVLTPLTPGGHRNDFPEWMPDGSVIYRSLAEDGTAKLMQVDASGAKAPRVLYDLGKVAGSEYPETISPDGRTIIVRVGAPQSNDLLALTLTGGEWTMRPLLASPDVTELFARISPDGKMLAYFEGAVFVRPYPDVARDRRRVSQTNGGDIAWARSGRELFLIAGTGVGDLYGITVQPGLVPAFGAEKRLFDARPYFPTSGAGTDYDTAPDGRFLMITRGQPTSLTIITHWLDEVRARVK